MKRILRILLITLSILSGSAAVADDYSDTVALFKNAGESASFFNDSYGYAVFPTIGQGGLVVGGAHGKGRVYENVLGHDVEAMSDPQFQEWMRRGVIWAGMGKLD